MTLDWSRWPSFSEAELRCRHTGLCRMEPAFMDRLQALRDALGVPLVPTSAFRADSHPIEAAKLAEFRRKGIDPATMPRTHARGRAVDLAADGALRWRIVAVAPALSLEGIGIAERFIHLDDWTASLRPNVWRYA